MKDKKNKILLELEKKLNSMAITIIDKNNKNARKNDCYAYVCYHIINNKIKEDDKIVIYSLGNYLGHCILVDNNNKIIADDFSKNLSKYNNITREIEYKNCGLLGKEYKFFYEIKLKDFKKKYIEILEEKLNIIDYKELKSFINDSCKEKNNNNKQKINKKNEY